jgi:hypothetical protein
VGPSAGVDAAEQRKIPRPYRELNPGRPAHKTVSIPTELSQLLYYKCISFSNIKFTLLKEDTASIINNIFIENHHMFRPHRSSIRWHTNENFFVE